MDGNADRAAAAGLPARFTWNITNGGRAVA